MISIMYTDALYGAGVDAPEIAHLHASAKLRGTRELLMFCIFFKSIFTADEEGGKYWVGRILELMLWHKMHATCILSIVQ